MTASVNQRNPTTSSSPAVGLIYALLAYLSWGFIAIYFKQLKDVPPMLVLGHRVVWSVAFLAILLSVTGQFRDVARCFIDRRTIAVLLASTLMIGCNWYTFIWAVSNKHLVEASFGYFMNPLVNVLLAVVVLKEKLRLAQRIAIFLAACGVVVMGMMAFGGGGSPIVSLSLAFSFGFYGLLRKIAPVGPLVGLSVETVLLFPLALAYVLIDGATGGAGGHPADWLSHPDALLDGWRRYGDYITILLSLGGVITAVPLLWFAAGARRLKFATVGFLQYLAPTCQLLLAVIGFKEPFTAWHAGSFAFIWLAIAVFTFDAVRSHRRRASERIQVSPAIPALNRS